MPKYDSKKRVKKKSKTIPCPVCDLPIKRVRHVLRGQGDTLGVQCQCKTCGYFYRSAYHQTEERMGAIVLVHNIGHWDDQGYPRVSANLKWVIARRKKIVSETRKMWNDFQGRMMMEVLEKARQEENLDLMERFAFWVRGNSKKFPLSSQAFTPEGVRESFKGDRRKQGKNPPDRDDNKPNSPRGGG